MQRTTPLYAVVLASLALAGCSTAGSRPLNASSSGKAHAECVVCKHENDLACVDIEVDDRTPRATMGGREYFFCSEDCRSECLKHPAKYVSPAK
jgi:YHS domain-containing protein